VGIFCPENSINEKETSKQKELGKKENPHSELSGFVVIMTGYCSVVISHKMHT
jgi:hypothetical protein